MALDQLTHETLRRADDFMDPAIIEDINHLLECMQSNSPLTDTRKILDRNDIKLDNIHVPANSWIPIRNVLRIIAYLIKLETPVSHIIIQSMRNGCDYFEGELEYHIGNTITQGKYMWQWTAFNGPISYDKFKVFPGLKEKLTV